VRTAQCEARNTASWMLCVTKMMVLPLSRQIRSISRFICLPGQGIERAKRLVHQDQFGIVMKARAIAVRCCMPPDNLLRILVLIAGKPDQIEQIARPRARRLPSAARRSPPAAGRCRARFAISTAALAETPCRCRAAGSNGVRALPDLDSAAVGVVKSGPVSSAPWSCAAGRADSEINSPSLTSMVTSETARNSVPANDRPCGRCAGE